MKYFKKGELVKILSYDEKLCPDKYYYFLLLQNQTKQFQHLDCLELSSHLNMFSVKGIKITYAWTDFMERI